MTACITEIREPRVFSSPSDGKIAIKQLIALVKQIVILTAYRVQGDNS